MFKILLVIFSLSLLEVYLFICIGHFIGAAWTVFLCLATALLGGFLVRHQGIQIIYKAQSSIQQGQLPAQQMLDGVCLCSSGILLFTPGFFTDALGFLLLIPALRNGLIRLVVASNQKMFTQTGFSQQVNPKHEDDIIEGEVVNKGNDLPKQ